MGKRSVEVEEEMGRILKARKGSQSEDLMEQQKSKATNLRVDSRRIALVLLPALPASSKSTRSRSSRPSYRGPPFHGSRGYARKCR